jgi:hypothetical protein
LQLHLWTFLQCHFVSGDMGQKAHICSLVGSESLASCNHQILFRYRKQSLQSDIGTEQQLP